MTILILGGTTEAADLARALVAHTPAAAAIFSLAGRTTRPEPAPIPMRIGGFGGADGLAVYLREQAITALVDATHPFAAIMPFNAAAACDTAGVPRLALRRPPWPREAGDIWTEFQDMPAAAAALDGPTRHVFLTIGRLELAPFAAMPQHHYLVRSIDPVIGDLPFPNATLLHARGPFEADAEERLMQAHRIDVLVTKNAGGAATAGKLVAARRLGLPVIMVARPAKPAGDVVSDVPAALAWLKAHGALP